MESVYAVVNTCKEKNVLLAVFIKEVLAHNYVDHGPWVIKPEVWTYDSFQAVLEDTQIVY